ncbi:MAG: P-loop NTPase [Candidatus Aenigmatarchaeota archaeon]
MKKIAIVSGKGGIGKTTLAINLGYLLHNRFNFETAVVDCNLTTPHLSINLGSYGHDRTINQVLMGNALLEESFLNHPTGIRILPASTELEDLKDVDVTLLGEALSSSTTNLILDSAPGLGREGIASIAAADEILFVTQPHMSAVVDIYRCWKIAQTQNKRALGIVVNCRKGLSHELSVNEIEQLTELPVISEIPFDLDVEKSLAAKLPLELYNAKSPANKAFYDLCSEITGFKMEQKKSFWGWFRGLFLKEKGEL